MLLNLTSIYIAELWFANVAIICTSEAVRFLMHMINSWPAKIGNALRHPVVKVDGVSAIVEQVDVRKLVSLLVLGTTKDLN